MESMSRRDFMKGLVVAASASAIPVSANNARSTKPNIVILFIDDLAYGELGAFGCPDIPTPHMDSLAANGVKCTNSYITNPMIFVGLHYYLALVNCILAFSGWELI